MVAGGTELFPRLKYRLELPELLISLKAIGPDEPLFSPSEGLRVDALSTLSSIARSETIRRTASLLAESARAVGSYEIRNMGTIGGNLCQQTRCLYYNQRHDFQFVEPCYKRGGRRCYFLPRGKSCMAVYMSDTATALLCLEAQLDIKGVRGSRLLNIKELYSGEAIRPLKIDQHEIITGIKIPADTVGCRGSFKKFSLRGGLEFGAVNLAVLVRMKSDGITCEWARIAVGSVHCAPLRAHKAESMLSDQRVSEDLITEVANVVGEEVKVVEHHGFSRSYLKELIKVLSKRALEETLARG